MQLLKLSYNCLNYDFIGTSTDESSDDLCTVQIPTSWRSGSCGKVKSCSLSSVHQMSWVQLCQTLCRCKACNFSVFLLSCSFSWFLYTAALFQFISFHPSVPFPVGKCAGLQILAEHDQKSCVKPLEWTWLLCCCVQVLSCLVQIASVRRSLFNNAERAKFLSHLVDGVKRILANPQVCSKTPLHDSDQSW